MRRGTFEEEDNAGGQKVYRLKWESKKYVLTPKEVSFGLFIRYLISRGKLNEFCDVPGLLDPEANEILD